jgi:hypothetical protein
VTAAAADDPRAKLAVAEAEEKRARRLRREGQREEAIEAYEHARELYADTGLQYHDDDVMSAIRRCDAIVSNIRHPKEKRPPATTPRPNCLGCGKPLRRYKRDGRTFSDGTPQEWGDYGDNRFCGLTWLELGVRTRADAEEEEVKRKKSNEERQAEEIERQSRLFCRWYGQAVDEHRVYFGVVGPFCNVACRDEYAKTPDSPAVLCVNCGLETHARCCSWCGKVHDLDRLHNKHCSAKCERDAARADRLSAAMEEDLT